MSNIALKPYAHASSFRRIAAAAWGDMYQATIYGQMKVRVEPIEAHFASVREQTGQKLTLTHAVARAVAIVLRRHPDINAIVRRSSLQLREDVDVFLQVVIPSTDPERIGKRDLSGLVLRKADTMDMEAMARTIAESAQRIRTSGDKEFERTKSQANTLPGWMLSLGLRFIGWLQYTWNVDTSFLGAPRDPFGSCMVTSVGMFGARVGFAPFFPLARCPLVLCIGAIGEEPVVEDGKVAIGRVVNIQATMDHRVIDGYHAALLGNEIRELLEKPELLTAARS